VERDRRLPGERVVRRHDGDEPVTGELAGLHAARARCGGQSEEGHLDGSEPDLLDEVLARPCSQADPHVRVPLPEGTQSGRDVDGRDGGDQPHGEASAYLADRRGGLGGGPLGSVETLAGGGQERGPGRRQPDPAAGALEEPHAQLPFQARDLVAERGLDHQAPLGGAGEAVRLGDGDDVAHLLQLHRSIVHRDRWVDKHVLDSSINGAQTRVNSSHDSA
jgi:hypothetical protein